MLVDVEDQTDPAAPGEAPAAPGDRTATGGDDEWKPIEGVSLEAYARLTAAMTAEGMLDPAAVETYVSGRGVPARAWPRITTGWSARLARDRRLRDRFEQLHRPD
jgi:hypothetical protein